MTRIQLAVALWLSTLVAAAAHAAAAPSDILSPVMNTTAGVTIISDPEYDVRDCTPPQQDTQGVWHVWCTRIPVHLGPSGYPGRVGHWYGSLDGSPWTYDTLAVNVSSDPTAYDSHGVFTPGSIYDAATETWVLFFGAVGPHYLHHSGSNFSELIGMATSKSPYGEFTKSPANPIVVPPAGPPPMSQDLPPGEGPWVRVDNARALNIGGSPVLVVKGVDLNFTALPAYFSAGPGWSSPFTAFKSNPLIPTNASLYPYGFENNEFFKGPDGLFHLIGRNHQWSPRGHGNPHFVSKDLYNWELAEMHVTWGEPAPVARGVPGTDMDVPTHFIRFEGKPLAVTLYPIYWEPVSSSSGAGL